MNTPRKDIHLFMPFRVKNWYKKFLLNTILLMQLHKAYPQNCGLFALQRTQNKTMTAYKTAIILFCNVINQKR